jgi:hypothetical protein
MEISALILVRGPLVYRGGLAAFPLPLPRLARVRRLEPDEGASD